MTSDQQRGLDQAIIEGRLIDAIRLYREATGVSLAAAEAYVNRRSAELSGPGIGAQPAAAEPDAGTAAPAAFTKRIGLLVGVIIAVSVIPPLLVTAATLVLSFNRFQGLLPSNTLGSIFSISSEPYYSAVVGKIETDRGFRNALGAPIVVDQGTFCNYIHDDPTQRKANCSIPVHGTRGTGSVQVRIVDQAGSIDLAGELQTGGRSIPIGS